ncbi:ribosomal RNA processing protein 36 homolog isoform X2 [Phalaenopsis equestris]|uniref:ribosomal RNA processing protein 36 homolog isoform X2 n=1 Tax=Phalaenopsis equestris TaxID=78828 RepID=UPI0009E495F0|nr:ribosomal RNA processing protein 36 homolog isoform X2 [Phalaenopsis equestris]
MVIKKPKVPILTVEEAATRNKNEEFDSRDKQLENLEQELADIPFEELQKARADGSHVIQQKPAFKLHDKPGRANKNRPMEMSSKVRVGRFREVIQAPKRVVRDPRFESLCGNLDTEGFRNRYSFLYEVELPAEKAKLQKLIKKSKNTNVIEDLKNHISWIDKQLKSSSHKNIESDILRQHIKKEKEAAKHGKHPYYLKKSEIRERKLIKKYEELKASGKLHSFIENRRKKNASKDHRFMPYRKSSYGDQSQIM